MSHFNHQSGNLIEVGDANIYVEELGFKGAEPLVFLHGGLGSIEDFGPLVDAFGKKFRCIGIDSRGHGRSTLGSSSPLTYEKLEEDIKTVLEKINIPRCSIVGFSDGGIAAYRLAVRNPSLVAKLVTIGADWKPPTADIENRFTALTPEKWEQRFPDGVSLYKRLNPDPDFARLLKSVVSMWIDRSSTGYPDQSLKNVQCPLLVIRGDEDHLMPRNVLGDLQTLVPKAKVLNIPFAGHMVHLEEPEIVGSLVLRFLDSAE